MPPTLEDLIAKRDSIKHNKRLDRQFKREANMPKTTNTKPVSKPTTPATPNYSPAMDLFRKNNATAQASAQGWNPIANYKDKLCVVVSFEPRESRFGQAWRYHALFLSDYTPEFVDANSPFLAEKFGRAKLPLIGTFTQENSKAGRPVWIFKTADVDTLPDLLKPEDWQAIEDFVAANPGKDADEIPF